MGIVSIITLFMLTDPLFEFLLATAYML